MSTSSNLSDEKAKRDEPDLDEIYLESRGRAMAYGRLYTSPWWLIIIVATGILIAVSIAFDEVYARIFDQLKEGISMTLGVSVISYFVALLIALFVGIIRSTPPQPPQARENARDTIKRILKMILYNVTTIYVSVMRGLPVLIVLLITAFILVPAVREFINTTFVAALRTLLNDPEIPDLLWRGSSAPTAIMALAVTYGAYMSETIRAGIQSIDKGQVEAAYSVGMTYIQTLRYIVLPQAFRNVLPPLGNDLVAIIKDSSLLAILGVNDITQVAKTSSGRSFRYLETYSIVAFIYLTMTIIGSSIVQTMEDTMNEKRQTPQWIVAIMNRRNKRKRKINMENYQ